MQKFSATPANAAKPEYDLGSKSAKMALQDWTANADVDLVKPMRKARSSDENCHGKHRRHWLSKSQRTLQAARDTTFERSRACTQDQE